MRGRSERLRLSVVRRMGGSDVSVRRHLIYIVLLLAANYLLAAILFFPPKTIRELSPFSSIPRHARLGDIPGLEQLREMITPAAKQSRPSVIVLLENYSTTCPGAALVEALKTVHEQRGNGVHLLSILLDGDLEVADLENFKRVLEFQLPGVPVQVSWADQRLRTWWTRSMPRSERWQSRAVMMVVDAHGRVREIVDEAKLNEVDRVRAAFAFEGKP